MEATSCQPREVKKTSSMVPVALMAVGELGSSETFSSNAASKMNLVTVMASKNEQISFNNSARAVYTRK